jgi:anti-sigma regulatory factor (Ser/Thr protein kinase)
MNGNGGTSGDGRACAWSSHDRHSQSVAERRRHASLQVSVTVRLRHPPVSLSPERVTHPGSRYGCDVLAHELKLPRDVGASGIARSWLVGLFAAELAESRLWTLKLLASELVNNAVLHGRGNITLRADLTRSRLLVEVIDDGPSFTPAPFVADPDRSDGWGLSMVATEACRWGVREGSAGVWFELDPDGDAAGTL